MAPNRLPERSQSDPRVSKSAPRGFQDAPRGSKKRSKRAPRGPLGRKRLQEAAKRPPRVDFDSPKALKEMIFELFFESESKKIQSYSKLFQATPSYSKLV